MMTLGLPLKRGMDFVISLGSLVFLSPLLVSLVVIGAVRMRGNPFFTQRRPGLQGKIFRLLKLRTMTNEKSSAGVLLPDHERLTSWGRFLRSTSLDELPQLWNVLVGEMSLVGPRPLLPEYLTVYTKTELKRHLMRPGISGWAQVTGRNATTWEARLSQDVWYVENWSLGLDFRILVMTFLRVLKRDGIMTSESVTMPTLVEVRRCGAKVQRNGAEASA